MNTTARDSVPLPFIDFSFPHRWQAEILPARPAILPARHFTYPRDAEEVERGALEVLIRPRADSEEGAPEPALGLSKGPSPLGTGETSTARTCALASSARLVNFKAEPKTHRQTRRPNPQTPT